MQKRKNLMMIQMKLRKIKYECQKKICFKIFKIESDFTCTDDSQLSYSFSNGNELKVFVYRLGKSSFKIFWRI